MTRLRLYSASRYLGAHTKSELGLRIPFDVYLTDPTLSAEDPMFGFDEAEVPWEPGISDGPTSSRFAIVDSDGDTGQTAAPAKWDSTGDRFLDPEDRGLDRHNAASPQFHQVHVWAVLQRALAFFEDPWGLGRPVPFAFEGNRLTVVPHAGPIGEVAVYDRASKSLRFSHVVRGGERAYACLSSDVIHHHFGHVILDGIRPYLVESTQLETAAFHEFVGDLTASLMVLRNNRFRGRLAEPTAGDSDATERLSRIAEEYGRVVDGNLYLRSSRNQLTMSDVAGERDPHLVSSVLTSAMFDILLEQARRSIGDTSRSAKQAIWNAVQWMQRIAVQPFDLLPPVEVTLKDYALAVLRAEELSNPTDPRGYFDLLLNAFYKRGIFDDADRSALKEPRYLYNQLRLSVFHEVASISRSRAAAYRFLNDNRSDLFIPERQDIVVADLYDAQKLSRMASRLPRQIVLEYVWREDVLLEGRRFGELDGEITSMLCGGTLVFDERGNALSWMRKAGSEGGSDRRWKEDSAAGTARRDALLDNLAALIEAGRIGPAGSRTPWFTTRRVAGALRFERTPHAASAPLEHDAE